MNILYILSVIFTTILFVIGLVLFKDNLPYATWFLFTGSVATSGLRLYAWEQFKSARIMLIVAGIITLPLGILLIIFGVKVKNTSIDVYSGDNGFGTALFIAFRALIDTSFWVVASIYHLWTLIIAFNKGMVAGLLTLFLPVISNIYWVFKMIDNSTYVWLAIITLAIKIAAYIIHKFNEA